MKVRTLPGAQTPPMKFSKGDKVDFLNETGGGTVLGYTVTMKVRLLSDDGFVNECEEDALVKKTRQQLYNMHLRHFPKDKGAHNTNNKANIKSPATVDLHIESLLETTLGLSNHEILRIQLSHFKQKMENAIESGAESITFIHGIGEGVLKFELTQRLKQYENITWENASMKKYGEGATKVVFQNRNR